MNQFAKTNDLQQAIDEIASNSQKAAPAAAPAATSPEDTLAAIQDQVNAAPVADVTESFVAPVTATPVVDAAPAPAPVAAAPVEVAPAPVDDFAAIRENIIKDLLPIMDHVQAEPEQKFAMYKEALATMHDKSVVTGAYNSARMIADEDKKAASLMEVMQMIENF